MLKNLSGPLVVLHPLTISSFNVCASIIVMKELTGQNILIITKDKNVINTVLPVSIPDNFYAEYTDQAKIDYFLRNETGYILIDDAELLKIAETRLPKTKIQIILIATLGVESINLENANYAYFNMLDEGPNLEYILHLNNNITQLILTIILSNQSSKHFVYMKDSSILEKQLEQLKIKYGFNDNSVNVIISDKMHISSLLNIAHIHFGELIDYYQYRAMIDCVYKKKNYTLPISILKLHFYVPEEETSLEKYKELSDILQKEQLNFSSLLKQSKPWSF